MELRKRQEECLDSILQNYLDQVYQQLIVQATGTGKMVVISNIYQKMRHLLPGKMLVLAHTEELIKQLVDNMILWNPDLKVGREQAEFYADTDCDVVVSCVQSIGREGATRLARFGEFDKVACDEAHHSIATTYMNIFESVGVLKPGSKKLLVGFTATPKRKNLTRSQKKQVTTLDEENLLSLKSVYKKIVYTYTIRAAIKEGWLVPLKGFRMHTETDLSEVKITAGDYQQDELSHAVNTELRNKQIVQLWMDHAENRQTVVFTVDINHAKSLAHEFQQKSVKAEAIWGTDQERNEKILKHKAKELTILCNAQLLVEGYDDWRIGCIVPAAPTKNSSRFTQWIGRGTRIQSGIGNLLQAIQAGVAIEKRDCIVLDVVDNHRRCSLVTFPSLLGLNPDFDLHGQDAVEAVERLEALQDRYPSVDLSNLTDLSKVKTYIESIDLLHAPYTEEVKEFSKLSWIASQDGSYVLAIPEKKELVDRKEYYKFLHEKLRIRQNDLDEYELIHSDTQRERLLGTYNTLKEAFETADDVVRRCRHDRTKLLQRDASWHQNPASEAAKKYLRKLTAKKPFLWCLCEGTKPAGNCPVCHKITGLTAGQAATALNVLKAK